MVDFENLTEDLDDSENIPTEAKNIELIINMSDINKNINPNLEDYEEELLNCFD